MKLFNNEYYRRRKDTKRNNDVKNQVCSAVANNDPETVMKLIRRIQELDHQLYDNRNDEY